MSVRKPNDPWRYRCPNNHTSWKRLVTNDGERQYWCQNCGHFGELTDTKQP